MPLYAFECNTCGVFFEHAQHMTDRTVPPCPLGHTNVRRVFVPPAVIFKGAGFYITDHRQPGKGAPESAGA
jgi:putative FmdB family regulatory protein